MHLSYLSSLPIARREKTGNNSHMMQTEIFSTHNTPWNENLSQIHHQPQTPTLMRRMNNIQTPPISSSPKTKNNTDSPAYPTGTTPLINPTQEPTKDLHPQPVPTSYWGPRPSSKRVELKHQLLLVQPWESTTNHGTGADQATNQINKQEAGAIGQSLLVEPWGNSQSGHRHESSRDGHNQALYKPDQKPTHQSPQGLRGVNTCKGTRRGHQAKNSRSPKTRRINKPLRNLYLIEKLH